MSAIIQKTLLIKHVTSRMFWDSRTKGGDFSLSPCDKGWKIVVPNIEIGILNEIKASQAELNLFYFEETEEEQSGRTIRKWWLYDTVLPELEADETARQLTLIVNTRTGYNNEQVNKEQ
jgi:hypothetical protein